MRHPPRILIADDIQMIRRALKIVLLKAGITGIVEAKNGKEVVEHLRQDQFDMIICDWEMPEMTGIETLRHVRQDARHKDIPFVMVTSVAEPENIRQAVIDGVTDYIVKPVKPDLFIGKIMFILRKLNTSKQQNRQPATIKEWVISCNDSQK